MPGAHDAKFADGLTYFLIKCLMEFDLVGKEATLMVQIHVSGNYFFFNFISFKSLLDWTENFRFNRSANKAWVA